MIGLQAHDNYTKEHIMSKQLMTKHIPKAKQTLLEKQNYYCPICNRNLRKHKSARIHLDHAHANEPNEHHIRGALCSTCNLALGAVWKVLVRQGVVNQLGVDGAAKWLKSAGVYYNKDYSKTDYHPNRIKDTVKHFKAKNKTHQLAILKGLGVEIPAKNTQALLCELYYSYYKEQQ